MSLILLIFYLILVTISAPTAPTQAHLLRMAEFVEKVLSFTSLLPRQDEALMPPVVFKLYEAHFALFHDVLTSADDPAGEFLLLSVLPVIESFAGKLEDFQSKCDGQLLLDAQQMAASLRGSLAAARLRYGITDAALADWHRGSPEQNAS